MSILDCNAATIEILPLDLDRDFAGIEQLLRQEEWPFVRGDLEMSHGQRIAPAYVARRHGEVIGFFCAHVFGETAYLDMMIVREDGRRRGVAGKLYRPVMRELRKHGVTGTVVHTTNDSFPLIRFLGFSAGQTYTLLAREPVYGRTAPLDARRLTLADHVRLTELDASCFGIRRPVWIHNLLTKPGITVYGRERNGQLTASLCIRPRAGRAVAIDAFNTTSSDEASRLLESVLAAYESKRIECFVRDGSQLDQRLRNTGFQVPPFFNRIGPLVEWRKGAARRVQLPDACQSLSWF